MLIFKIISHNFSISILTEINKLKSNMDIQVYHVSLIALSSASYEVGTTAPASLKALFFACADSNSPPLLAPCFH